MFSEYELSGRPLAIANSDGSVVKTNKARTRVHMEETDQSIHDLESSGNVINSESQWVATCNIHRPYGPHSQVCYLEFATSGDMSDALQETIQNAFKLSDDTVQLISDRYDINGSVKAGERKRHDQTVGSPEIRIGRSQVLPRNMRVYPSNPKNKGNLNSFMFEEWYTCMASVLNKAQTLVLSDGFENLEFLYIHDAIGRYGTQEPIIWSSYTNTLVLCIYFTQ